VVVRELEHAVYHGLPLTEGAVISLDLPPSLLPQALGSQHRRGYRDAKEQAISDFEHGYLVQLIERANGNVSVAARLASTERRHLGRSLKKHRLSKPASRV
jgi:DNA-binding NtrC family response regulator